MNSREKHGIVVKKHNVKKQTQHNYYDVVGNTDDVLRKNPYVTQCSENRGAYYAHTGICGRWQNKGIQ